MIYRLDERDPFVQLVFRSIAVTVVLVFATGFVLSATAPELSRPMFVPLAAAYFCGTLAFLVAVAKRRYVIAILGFVAAVFLFPGLGWGLLLLFHISSQTTVAAFVTLIPQAVVGPSVFFLIRNRFERNG